MFGRMSAVPIIDLKHAADEVGGCADGAVARLLEVTEQPRIEKWVQFPKAVFVFLIVPGDPESGAFYVYDRLVRECRFLDLVECPASLKRQTPWIVQPGARPKLDGVVTSGGSVSG